MSSTNNDGLPEDVDPLTHAFARRLGYSWEAASVVAYKGRALPLPAKVFATAEDRREVQRPAGVDEQLSQYARRHSEDPAAKAPVEDKDAAVKTGDKTGDKNDGKTDGKTDENTQEA